METLLNNPPPLGHPDRAAWNRRLDEALGRAADTVAKDALQSRDEARRRGDAKAADIAETVIRRAGRE